MNFKAFLNTVSSRCWTLPVVILYVTEGCNLQCITCSYRKPAPDELTFKEIEQLATTLVSFGLKHVVFSGGEPLLRKDFPAICSLFQSLGIQQTLLTNGLLLEKRLSEVMGFFDEIIVSIDGADEKTHNAIRGVSSFTQIEKGIRLASETPGCAPISIRTVVQKRNFRQIQSMVGMAKSLRVNRISFLAADVLSGSFGRDRSGPVAPDDAIMLNSDEAREFRHLVKEMIVTHADDIRDKFVSESPGKLMHLVEYFEALLGKRSFPRNHCNAPMVSAVVTSTGDVQPCYFLPAYGSIRDTSLTALANSPHITAVRNDVRNYDLERCQTCVCTLYVKPFSALAGK